jgi:hypothetical protein
MMRLALAEWVKFVDISQLSVALHCNSLPRFIEPHIFICLEYKFLDILLHYSIFARFCF